MGGSTPCSRELFMFRTEGSTSARGSAHFRRELFLFSREHLCRRECSLQQGAIHVQEGMLNTTNRELSIFSRQH